MIKVFNKETGISEAYSASNLNFIRRSYEEYADKEMTDSDFRDLALKLTRAKYEGSRFENLEWEISVTQD